MINAYAVPMVATTISSVATGLWFNLCCSVQYYPDNNMIARLKRFSTS